MWENSSKDINEEKHNSMQNILKNFNPYEILEPLAPEGIPKENVLVDLTDNGLRNGPDMELSGSLLDRSTKTDFDVIDVFQNLFVTPQHVNCVKLQENKDWIKAFDGIDHRNIEDIDVKKELESVFTVNKETELNVTLERLSDEVDVDEIYEVLSTKRMQKLQYVDNSLNNVESSSNVLISQKSIQSKHIINSACLENKQEYIRTNFPINNSEVNKIHNTRINNFKLLKTIKLDKKKLQKKRVLPDDEKRNYTKGPDLVEKSICLPAILERLRARHSIDNEKYLKQQLILEPDKKIPQLKHTIERPLYNFNPLVLNEDCNRQRITALQAGRSFEKFVIGEK